ncbi:MAG: glycosyltransferase family 4 protein [Ignavibacteriaceae bacterium]|nr:glycosyltransferase family 4 protein [Ignavibacteriaceae bacterium]
MDEKSIKDLKILELITLFSIGGATETVVSLAAGLKSEGFRVDIATGPNIASEGSMYEEAANLGLNVFTLPYVKREIKIIQDLVCIYKLIRFIRQGNYDIVHTHSSKAGVVGRIAARLAGAKVVVHTVHGLPFHRYQKPLVKYFFIFVEKITSHFCDGLVAVSSTIIETMLGYGIRKREHYHLIRSAFDTESFTPDERERKDLRSSLGIYDDTLVLAKAARLSPLKGHRYLLEALSILRSENLKLKTLLIGNGEIESELKQYVDENGMHDSVIFTGLISPEKIPSYLNASDVLVHTSLLEGLARVLPQAIVLEKPVIVFNLDGAPEVVKDGVNGFLIEPENVAQLASRIRELVADRDKVKRFGKAGKEMIGGMFDDATMVDQTIRLYKELWEAKR